MLPGLSWDGYSVQEAEVGKTGMYVWVSRKVLSLVPDRSSAHSEDFTRFHKTQGTVQGLRLPRQNRQGLQMLLWYSLSECPSLSL